jgi:hypothetical protein
MRNLMQMAVDSLYWLTFWGRNQTAPPSHVVPPIDSLQRILAPAWKQTPTAFIGPILDHPVREKAHKYRAAVLILDGIGVLVWTAAEREAAKRLKSGEINELKAEFVRFERCHLEVQKALLPHISPLLERSLRQLTGTEESAWRNS